MAASDRDLALRLMAKDPTNNRDEGTYLFLLANIVRARRPNEGKLEWLAEKEQMPDTLWSQIGPGGGFSPEDATAYLLKVVREEIADIEQKEEKLRREVEEPVRAVVEDCALALKGAQAETFRRNAKMNESAFYKVVEAARGGRAAVAAGTAAAARGDAGGRAGRPDRRGPRAVPRGRPGDAIGGGGADQAGR